MDNNSKMVWLINFCDGEECGTLRFKNYKQAYDYALTMCYLMFDRYFDRDFIKQHFDAHNGFRLGADVVSLN